jgi:iron complex outermembrane receptor protein
LSHLSHSLRVRLCSCAASAALLGLPAGAAHAQRVDDNAVKSASDAFGTSVGNERIGLYNDNNARGFSPSAAGNIRMEGLYIDGPPVFSGRLVSGSTLRVGIAAQGYPFPAPTGIADYALRGVGREGVVSANATAGPFGTRSLSLDTQQPLLDGRLGFAGGVATGRFEAAPGAVDEQSAAGGVLHWRASERLLIQPFFAVFDLPSLRSTPQVFTDGSVAPPPSPARNFSPTGSRTQPSSRCTGLSGRFRRPTPGR